MAVIDNDNLSTYNNLFKEKIEDLQDYILDFKNAYIDIASNWEGPSYNSFSAKMEDFFSDINKVTDYIEQLNEYLDGYLKDIKKLEDKYSSENMDIRLE